MSQLIVCVKIADDLLYASCDRMALDSMLDDWLEAGLPHADASLSPVQLTL